MNPLGKCPKCKKSWKGKAIAKDLRKHYRPPFFFSKLISIYDRDKDRTVEEMCPFCKTRFEV